MGAPSAAEETPDSPQPYLSGIAEQLSRINEQLVIKNRRSSRIWKIVGGVILGWVLVYLIGIILSVALFSVRWSSVTTTESTVRTEESASADGSSWP